MAHELIIRRRRIGPEDLQRIRDLVLQEGARGRTYISRRLCRLRDWQQVYRQDLALCETFVEPARFGGHSYAAANWICVGQTRGRGRNDRRNQGGLPIKAIWLYPLRPDFRQVLCPAAP